MWLLLEFRVKSSHLLPHRRVKKVLDAVVGPKQLMARAPAGQEFGDLNPFCAKLLLGIEDKVGFRLGEQLGADLRLHVVDPTARRKSAIPLSTLLARLVVIPPFGKETGREFPVAAMSFDCPRENLFFLYA
jgi:hypothetical protein